MIEDVRWVALVSTVTAVISAGAPLLGTPLDWQNSVSYSWSVSRRKFLVVGAILSLAGAGMCAGLLLWVIPHYHLPRLMYGIVVVAYIALMGIAWVPMDERPGEHSYFHYHFLGGGLIASLAIVAMASVVWFSTGVPYVTRVTAFLAMVFAIGWPLLFIGPAKRVFLAFESLIALTFLGTVILLFIDLCSRRLRQHALMLRLPPSWEARFSSCP